MVITNYGPVQGEQQDNIVAFRGIPYAAPPIGPLRWAAPQAPDVWQDPVSATTFGPACWQPVSSGNDLFMERLTEGAGMNGFTQWLLSTALTFIEMEVSEDCLTLNVVAPNNPGKPLPVMFWIHGGGHQFGDGGQAYESASLAERGVVLVSINYRLGLYGFMAHPELAAEDPHGSTGNYGMLDQIAALQWVRDNIEAFGGDPDNVTIFGESAGAHSVGQLMASPLAEGLFHRAIAQSGTGFYQFQATQESYERMSGFEAGRAVAAKLGVTGDNEIEALRKLSIEELIEAATDPIIGTTFHPQIDGYVLPQSTAQVFMAGKQAPVPLIVGSNADEGSVLYHLGIEPVDGSGSAQPTTLDEWDTLLAEQFPQAAQALADAYVVDDDTDVIKAAEQLMGDSLFGRHAFYMAQLHSAAGHPAYLYFYERRPPTDSQTIGASHALELNHVFGSFIPMWPSDERDAELRNQMQQYWTAFADSGTPVTQDNGSTPWPSFNELQPQEMNFGHQVTQARPVARELRYRAMHDQMQRRLRLAWIGDSPAGP